MCTDRNHICNVFLMATINMATDITKFDHKCEPNHRITLDIICNSGVCYELVRTMYKTLE